MNTIQYQLVSEGAILRDYIEPAYVNREHKMLVDIADFLYGANLSAEYLKPEYKILYDEYGSDYWNDVLKDMSAIKSQLTSREKAWDLAEEYQATVGEAVK